MSEPYAALVQVTIERSALIRYLDARPRSPSQWNDWRRIGGKWHGFSWDEGLEKVLARVDEGLGASYRDAVHQVLDASEIPAAGICSYDAKIRRFSFGTLTFSENLNDIVFFFAAARGLAEYLGDRESGFALIHNYLWGDDRRTIAVIGLGASDHSYFLDPAADASAYQQHVAEATAVFHDIYQRCLELANGAGKHDSGKPAPNAADQLNRLR